MKYQEFVRSIESAVASCLSEINKHEEYSGTLTVYVHWDLRTEVCFEGDYGIRMANPPKKIEYGWQPYDRYDLVIGRRRLPMCGVPGILAEGKVQANTVAYNTRLGLTSRDVASMLDDVRTEVLKRIPKLNKELHNDFKNDEEQAKFLLERAATKKSIVEGYAKTLEIFNSW